MSCVQNSPRVFIRETEGRYYG
jgi:hypothetical protein